MLDKLDPVIVMTALVGALMGQELAQLIGPYSVVILAATTGAGWSLGQQAPMSRAMSIWYFAKLNFTALLLTVPMAALVTATFKLQEANWLLVPISLLVGGIGNDWHKVGRWIVTRFARIVDRWTDDGKGF